jgi:hypothetical protein
MRGACATASTRKLAGSGTADASMTTFGRSRRSACGRCFCIGALALIAQAWRSEGFTWPYHHLTLYGKSRGALDVPAAVTRLPVHRPNWAPVKGFPALSPNCHITDIVALLHGANAPPTVGEGPPPQGP